MEQILTLAASLEPGKPTSISNEDILPPGKSRTYRFITYLVLGSFLWSTILPSVAMDAVSLEESRRSKRITVDALVWLRDREEKREVALHHKQQDCLEALTKEISATLGGKYGISDRPATEEERQIMLQSIVKTRREFKNKLNIINDFYFSYDQPTCWGKVDNDLSFSSHMAVVAAADGLSWGLLNYEGNRSVELTKRLVVNLAESRDQPALVEALNPAVSMAIKNMVGEVHASRQSIKDRGLLGKFQPKDWDYLTGLSSYILNTSLSFVSVTLKKKDRAPEERHEGIEGLYAITRDLPAGDGAVIIEYKHPGGLVDRYKGEVVEEDDDEAEKIISSSKIKMHPRVGASTPPTVLGTRPEHYAEWVRATRDWVENQEALELFDVTFTDKKGVSHVLKLMEIEDYSPLTAEVGYKTSPDKKETALFIKKLLKGVPIEGDLSLMMPHVLIPEFSLEKGSREKKILRSGGELYYPAIFLHTYFRPAIQGISGLEDLEGEEIFEDVKEVILEQNNPIGNKTYEVRAEGEYSEDQLFVKDIFKIHSKRAESSPYLWRDGAEDRGREQALYLTRTVKAFQQEKGDDEGGIIKGWIRYTSPTPLRLTATVREGYGMSGVSGVFQNIHGRWCLLNINNYRPHEPSSHYNWNIEAVTAPGDLKKSQFLLDIDHAQEILDLSRVKLVLSAPFASEETHEFRGKNVPKSIPAFAILESAFYPPFPLPASLVNLTLTGPSSAPLSLNSGQAREIGSLRLLRTLRLQNVTISDTDLAISLRQALQHVTLNAVQSLGKETVRRLIALRTVSYPPLQTLILSDRLHFTDLFYGEHPYPTQALTRDMSVFLDQESNTPDRALELGNRFKVSDTSKAKKYYRIAACQGNTAPSKEGAYQLAMLIKPSNKKEALTFFDRAAEANGRGHPLAAFEAAKIHQDGSTIPSIPQDTARAKTLFRAAADHAVARSAEQREATLLLGDLLRKSDSASEKSQARTYYENLDDWHISDLSDPFKGKALLAHGQMLLNGEGGSVGYMTAIRKLDASRAFRNVPAQASQDWARANFEVARDLWISEQRRKERKDRILGLITDDVIRLYYPAKAIQGALLAEGYYTPDQADGHILLAHIDKAVKIFEGVLAHRLSEKSPNVLPFCHYWLGRLKRADISISTPDLEGWSGYPYYPQTINTHTDRPQALDYTLKVIRSTESGSASANALSRQDQELSKLWFGNLLWEIYKGSSDNTLLRRALMVSANHVWNIENNTQDTDTKAKALEIGLKMDGALKASGLGSIKSFPKQADTEEDDLVKKSQDEQDKQIAEAQARAAAEYALF